MRIAIGSDHAGFDLKALVGEHLRERGHEVADLGTHDRASTDYPDHAARVARAVQAGEADLGLLVCGTGQGMAMTANRFTGIRAAVCGDTFSAEAARRHNDANVLCLGARVVGPGLALAIVDHFLAAPFEGGRHARRVARMQAVARDQEA